MQAVLILTLCPACKKRNRLIVTERAGSVPTCGSCGSQLFGLFQVVRGHIYILSNPAMPGLLKIGQTSGRLTTRVAQLSSATGVPKPFSIEAAFFAEHPKDDEAKVHLGLKGYRAEGREFFFLSVREAIRFCEATLAKKPHYVGSRDGVFREP